MEITGWKKLFAPHILMRGQEYYESELVEIEAMDEQSIKATVEGTEPYSVEIVLKNSRVAQMDCDCPYAADGNNCKHMAAVLFAADDTESSEYPLVECITQRGKDQRKERDSVLTKAIDALSETQLRSFLLDAAKKHSDVRDRITMFGKAVVDSSVRKRWATELKDITKRAADRSGFIDYYHASDYTTDLSVFLDETIEPLLENRMIMDAFDLVGMVFVEAMLQEIDDSDGGISFVVSGCQKYWKALIPAPEADQARMLDWFSTQIRRFSGDVGEDFLWPIVFEAFTDAKLLPKILTMLDKRIKSANEYELEYLIKQRIALMEQMGASAEEIEAYRKKFWAQPFIRKQELDRLEAGREWKEALALLRECEQFDAEEPRLLSEYSERRVRILKQSGPEWAWLQALKRYIFGFPQRDLTYISELKRSVSAEQWPELLKQLLENKNTQALRRELQLSEGLLEQMMSEMEASRYAYELEKYEKVLRQAFPERVRDLRIKQLDEQMRQASSRGAYARIAQTLKLLYGYPDGRKKVAELAAGWRRDFPRRTAMLEELKKVKL